MKGGPLLTAKLSLGDFNGWVGYSLGTWLMEGALAHVFGGTGWALRSFQTQIIVWNDSVKSSVPIRCSAQ